MLPATLIPSTTGATKSRTERKAEADMDHDNELDIREHIEAKRLVRVVRGEIAGDKRGAEEQLCSMGRNPAKPDEPAKAPWKYRTTAYFPAAMTKADAKKFLAGRGR